MRVLIVLLAIVLAVQVAFAARSHSRTRATATQKFYTVLYTNDTATPPKLLRLDAYNVNTGARLTFPLLDVSKFFTISLTNTNLVARIDYVIKDNFYGTLIYGQQVAEFFFAPTVSAIVSLTKMTKPTTFAKVDRIIYFNENVTSNDILSFGFTDAGGKKTTVYSKLDAKNKYDKYLFTAQNNKLYMGYSVVGTNKLGLDVLDLATKKLTFTKVGLPAGTVGLFPNATDLNIIYNKKTSTSISIVAASFKPTSNKDLPVLATPATLAGKTAILSAYDSEAKTFIVLAPKGEGYITKLGAKTFTAVKYFNNLNVGLVNALSLNVVVG